ncbi:MAG: type II toxin-antitoxin system death-on-curing family toxin [Actinomycetota bacterium]|nr:type II toxin-antitoxin system death-on-curing family toxin [Actinomycetota bacterium]
MSPVGEKPELSDVLFFHAASIKRYGGSLGVRDGESVLAAVEHPWQASFGREHFGTPFDKAASLMESIIRRHPFVDGNKRTATASAAYLLSTSSYRVGAEQKDLEDFAVSVAEGKLKTSDISSWFEKHTRND